MIDIETTVNKRLTKNSILGYNMSMLKESLEQFTAPVYGKTKRSADTYRTVAAYCTKNINRLVDEYRAVKND